MTYSETKKAVSKKAHELVRAIDQLPHSSEPGEPATELEHKLARVVLERLTATLDLIEEMEGQ